VSTASLRADVRRLQKRGLGRRAAVSADRVQFAAGLGIVPDPWQEDLLHSGSDRILLNCSRQSGKSTMSAVVALHRAIHRPGSLVLCLAPSERQSKELFAKVADLQRALHDAPPTASDRKLGMVLANGSRIEALPGSERTIRGFSGVDLLLVDEASRVDDELYFAARPMLAVSGGALMMLSTPAGRRGVFHQEWTEGTGWERYEIPAEKCPRISEAFLEEERGSLPRRVFDQEYRCVFTETEDTVFSFEDVAGALDPGVTPLFGSPAETP
jgi:hypothetical protein